MRDILLMGLSDRFRKKNNSPDFSGITQREAQKMLEAGELELMYLIDPRFGGSEAMDNCLYVPAGVTAVKEHFDNTVELLLIEGKVKGYDCRPSYKNGSVIPCSIMLKASDKNRKEVLHQFIEIW